VQQKEAEGEYLYWRNASVVLYVKAKVNQVQRDRRTARDGMGLE
jgi:hypothetical protein